MGLTHHPHGVSSFGVPVIPGISGLNAMRKVYFVAGGGGSARTSGTGSDGNSGLSMERAFRTVQKALNVVKDQDAILVMEGDYNEALATGLQEGGITTIARYAGTEGRGRDCTLMGISPGPRVYAYPQLYNRDVTADATLNMRSEGWRVSGFRIIGNSTSPLGVKLNWPNSAGTAGTAWSPGTRLDFNNFYGLTGAHSGIDFDGSPPNCHITDNVFEFYPASFAAITQSSNSIAAGGREIVARNFFLDSVQYLNLAPGGFWSSFITHNMFQPGVTATTLYIDNTGGKFCTVTGNYFPGDYSNTGGYTAGTSDSWSGNFADDTDESEVTGAITIGVPAA